MGETITATIESQRNLLTFTTLHDLGRRLTFTLADPKLLMRDIVINAARVMDADSVSLHQYDPIQEEFHSYDKSITYGIETYPPSKKPREEEYPSTLWSTVWFGYTISTMSIRSLSGRQML